MLRRFYFIVVAVLALGFCGPVQALESDANVNSIEATIDQFKSDPSIKPYFDNAYAYVVFPNVVKGGIIIGFGEGSGKMYKQGSYTGDVVLTNFSLGAQFGAQSYKQVIFIENKRAYQNFVANGVTLNANASAAFATLGANAQAGSGGVSASSSTGDVAANTDPKMKGAYSNSIATFVLTKAGVMFQATLGGETFEFTPADQN